jgi:hypothetical protein|tara:strand:+ start:369 stop:560 length:192 start_codon:yes stop_codon:yes gene_type:complete
MEYTGKLYGKIGSKYFDTGKTANDIDKLAKEVERLTVRIHTWHEAQNMTKAQAKEYLSRPDNQ